MTKVENYAKRLGLGESDEQLALIGEAGYFWMKLGRFKDALSVFEGLSILVPRDPAGFMGMAEAMMRLGRFAEAERAVLDGLSAPHVSPAGGRYLYILLGEARFAQGSPAEAISAWSTVVDLSPRSTEATVAQLFIDGAREIENASRN